MLLSDFSTVSHEWATADFYLYYKRNDGPIRPDKSGQVHSWRADQGVDLTWFLQDDENPISCTDQFNLYVKSASLLCPQIVKTVI